MDEHHSPGPSHRVAAAQVFVADLDGPVLDDHALHHLSRVLRLRNGQVVCAADGRGSWRPTTFGGSHALEAIGEPATVAHPTPELTVAFVPVKADRPELVVQKLTEVGVDRMIVCHSARSVVRWEGERAARHIERLRRVAREASQQCRRLWLPTVDLGTFDRLRAEGAVLAHPGGRPLGEADRTVVIGPEGGWTDVELFGPEAVSVGEHVLRAETAAIAAGVLMTALRGASGGGSTTAD